MKLLVGLAGILLLISFKNGLALQCYECDTNTDPTMCTNHLTKDCFPGEICVKSDRIINKERIIKKGCIQSLKHENKCEVKEDSEDLTETLCLCSTDLCNDANVKTMSKLVAISLILIAILMNFV